MIEHGPMTCMNEMNEMNLDGVEMKETTITMEVRGAAPPQQFSSTIMIRGIPLSTNDRTLEQALAPYKPLNVRLIRSKDTGGSRGFAFVDFSTVNDAVALMDKSGRDGRGLYIDGRAVTLEFSEPTGHGGGAGNSSRAPRLDWMCAGCGAQNFARRVQCFKCGSPKTDDSELVSPLGSHAPPADDPTSTNPSPLLVVKSLDPNSTDLSIADAFRSYAQVKEVRMIRERHARPFAYVEFYSVEYAVHVMNTAKSLKIDDSVVRLAFARITMMPRTGFAIEALQSAKWSVGGGGGSSDYYANNNYSATPPVSNKKPKAQKKIRPWPPSFDEDGLAWQFDPHSQFFFEPTTAFYYEPKSKAYFNTKDQKYYHHNPGHDPPYVPYPPTTTGGTGASNQMMAAAPAAPAAYMAGGAPAAPASAIPARQATSTDNSATSYPPSGTPQTANLLTVASGKPPVSFGLKGVVGTTNNNSAAAGSKQSGKANAAHQSITAKKNLKDITKWGDRQREMTSADSDGKIAHQLQQQHRGGGGGGGGGGGAASSLKKTALATTTTTGGGGGGLETTGISTTSDNSNLLSMGTTYACLERLRMDGKPLVKHSNGKWVCLVSRRGFPNEEALEKHVHLSDLYKSEFQKALGSGRISLIRAEERS
eukprot:CAMPEP_0185762410 /NCGR_PEP_ID=MMETSP1174-20130828/21377_1 /TAXON_ID=35687 /ORGANISM="Dictyocha speculum, Strain CCMP1381" /LENGTH=647 /DNA_ID=CAMNT_0028444075 /DNA_START=60 /DNA_END=2002 /DNA_ORIENTATION=+